MPLVVQAIICSFGAGLAGAFAFMNLAQSQREHQVGPGLGNFLAGVVSLTICVLLVVCLMVIVERRFG